MNMVAATRKNLQKHHTKSKIKRKQEQRENSKAHEHSMQLNGLL